MKITERVYYFPWNGSLLRIRLPRILGKLVALTVLDKYRVRTTATKETKEGI
jgi:hypothetical protein